MCLNLGSLVVDFNLKMKCIIKENVLSKGHYTTKEKMNMKDMIIDIADDEDEDEDDDDSKGNIHLPLGKRC